MRLRIYLLGIAILAVAAIGLPATASASRCSITCQKPLLAKHRAQRWDTPQSFGETTTPIISVVGPGGRFLPRILLGDGCKGIYRGFGLRVTVRVCGHGSVPIRVIYRALGKSPVHFTLAYEVN